MFEASQAPARDSDLLLIQTGDGWVLERAASVFAFQHGKNIAKEGASEIDDFDAAFEEALDDA